MNEKHELGTAVVAKGVSPPNLASWLLICLFSNKSAANLAALLYFGVQGLCAT
jgi:hypothetical protein